MLNGMDPLLDNGGAFDDEPGSASRNCARDDVVELMLYGLKVGRFADKVLPPIGSINGSIRASEAGVSNFSISSSSGFLLRRRYQSKADNIRQIRQTGMTAPMTIFLDFVARLVAAFIGWDLEVCHSQLPPLDATDLRLWIVREGQSCEADDAVFELFAT